MSETRARLLRLADDCEERARKSDSANARALYWLAAKDARQASAARHMGEAELRDTLCAMDALAQTARWYDGDMLDANTPPESIGSPLQPISALEHHRLTPSPVPASTPPVEALNARQLAARFGMHERTVRRSIERGVRKGVAGFYRYGCHWFAEPEALERARQG